jgi:hypothetical protein
MHSYIHPNESNWSTSRYATRKRGSHTHPPGRSRSPSVRQPRGPSRTNSIKPKVEEEADDTQLLHEAEREPTPETPQTARTGYTSRWGNTPQSAHTHESQPPSTNGPATPGMPPREFIPNSNFRSAERNTTRRSKDEVVDAIVELMRQLARSVFSR